MKPIAPLSLLALLLCFSLLGCPSTTGDDDDSAGDDDDATGDDDDSAGDDDDATGDDDDATGDDDDATSSSCATGGSSTLEGVSVVFPTDACVFTLAEAAAGIEIPYDVIIDAQVDNVTTMPQDAGFCDTPGPSGVHDFARLSGDGHQYCICDTGICEKPDLSLITLEPGSYRSVFAWEGRNWTGPSDFGNPVGEPFPPGTYTLAISAVGQVADSPPVATPYEVVGTLEIELLP